MALVPAVVGTSFNDFKLLTENAGFPSSPHSAAPILLLT